MAMYSYNLAPIIGLNAPMVIQNRLENGKVVNFLDTSPIPTTIYWTGVYMKYCEKLAGIYKPSHCFHAGIWNWRGEWHENRTRERRGVRSGGREIHQSSDQAGDRERSGWSLRERVRSDWGLADVGTPGSGVDEDRESTVRRDKCLVNFWDKKIV